MHDQLQKSLLKHIVPVELCSGKQLSARLRTRGHESHPTGCSTYDVEGCDGRARVVVMMMVPLILLDEERVPLNRVCCWSPISQPEPPAIS